MRAALIAFGLAAALAASPAAAQDLSPRLTVVGTAEAEAAPDLARFSAGVQAEAVRAQEAFAATGAAMQAILAALAAEGIAPEDVQTSQVSVEPLWTDGSSAQPRVRGYVARNLVTVRVRDMARLGPVIDAAGLAGANTVGDIAFEATAPREALDAARRAAVADARARAELLAEASGVTLGRVLSIREQGGAMPGPMFARAEMAMDTPVAPGMISLGAQVEIVYAIE